MTKAFYASKYLYLEISCINQRLRCVIKIKISLKFRACSAQIELNFHLSIIENSEKKFRPYIFLSG